MTGEGRIDLEAAHARRLDVVEQQLVEARLEALQLGLSTASIDEALLAIGSQALKRTASGRIKSMPGGERGAASQALGLVRDVLLRSHAIPDRERAAIVDVARLLTSVAS